MTEKLEPGLEQVEIKQTRTAPDPIRFNNATINKTKASQYIFIKIDLTNSLNIYYNK